MISTRLKKRLLSEEEEGEEGEQELRRSVESVRSVRSVEAWKRSGPDWPPA
jgi:hypothetical protein